MKAFEPYGETPVDSFDDENELLCLSFVNTADWHASDRPEELLKSYGDLLTWARLRAVVTGDEAAELSKIILSKPTLASKNLEKAIRLRETTYRLFVAAADRRPLPVKEIEVLNQILPDVLGQLQLATVPDGVTWDWKESELEPDIILRPVIRSAAELLTSETLRRVGQCQDDRGCGWLFLDHSRNHSRRWCSMERCGNRAKARRHYHRISGKAEEAIDAGTS